MECQHYNTELADHAHGRGRNDRDEFCTRCNLLRSDLVQHMAAMPHDFNPDEMDEQEMWVLGAWHRSHHESKRFGEMVTDHDLLDYGDKVPYIPVDNMIADLKAMLCEQ